MSTLRKVSERHTNFLLELDKTIAEPLTPDDEEDSLINNNNDTHPSNQNDDSTESQENSHPNSQSRNNTTVEVVATTADVVPAATPLRLFSIAAKFGDSHTIW